MLGSGCTSATVVVVATVAGTRVVEGTPTVVDVTPDVVTATNVLVVDDDVVDETAGATVLFTRVSLVTDTESSNPRATNPDSDQISATTEMTPRTCSATGRVSRSFHQRSSVGPTAPGYACWPTGAPASRPNT
ncbi:MAG: hypothetical protein QOJ69_2122 [Actinomycetota bacterium]|nr:hypothetical protein [Actinomycetota bacterium]